MSLYKSKPNMFNKKHIFLLLILTALCFTSFGQSIQVIGKDTSAIIPIQNLRQANEHFIQLKECKEENDSLFSQIRTYQGLINNLKSAIEDYKKVFVDDAKLISDKDKIISLSDKELKHNARKTKWLKIERNVLFFATAILSIKIFIVK